MSNKLQFEWQQSYTGGGGYITGLIQDHNDSDILYARCDVAGVFKSENNGKAWQAVNSGLTKWYNHSVRSIAISPHNSQIIFRCSGDLRNDKLFGSIHKSADGGETWNEVNNLVDYWGNGPKRMFGELISVDPFNYGIVITGTYSQGIWRSDDQGENWQHIGLKGEQFSCVAFHPYQKGMVYAGVIDQKEPNKIGKLYISYDSGQQWELIHNKLSFSELCFSKDNPEIIHAACIEEGINTSYDGGETFESSMKGLPAEYKYNTVINDPNNTSTLYTAPDARPGHDLSLLPIYCSSDEGQSWELINDHKEKDFINYPDSMEEYKHGWAISKLRVDLENSDQLYYCNWYGVGVSYNQGQQWHGHQFQGLETVCIESVQVDPLQSGQVYYTVADHPPAVSKDNGEKYQSFKHPRIFQQSTAFSSSRFRNDFILYGAISLDEKKVSGIVKVENEKSNPEVVFKLPKGYFVQAIKEGYHKKGRFYAYIEGPLTKKAGLYVSEDWGNNWQQINLDLPDYIKTLPHRAEFIENELLNIVVGQRKNVCGTNKLLEVDPFQPDTLYFGEWTEGIFKSEDRGQSWCRIDSDLPFHNNYVSTLAVIKTDPERKGRVYAGFVREGLWYSDNGGQEWEKLFPLKGLIFNATSLALKGQEIYIAGETLFHAQCESAVYYSPDLGKTWFNIMDKNLGALRLKGIAVDEVSGRLHVVTSGNGCYFIDCDYN